MSGVRVSRRFAGLLCVIMLAITGPLGCSGPDALPPLDRGDTVMAFGDSLTAGYGVADGLSYPAVLAERSGVTVINAGVSGETTSEGKRRLPDALARERPKLLILIEGGNDLLRDVPHERIRQNLAEMIQTAQELDVPVVLIGVPEKRLFSYSAPFYEALADEFNLVYDGKLLGRLLRDASMKSDPIHFNEAGYRAMAEGIEQLLQQAGAL